MELHEGQDRTRGNRQGPAEKGHSTREAGHRLGTPELPWHFSCCFWQKWFKSGTRLELDVGAGDEKSCFLS